MTSEEFNALKAKATEDLKFDKTNAMSKCQEIPSLYQHWLDIFNRESAKLVKLQLEQDKLYGDLYKKYRHYSDLSWDSQKEVESQIKCDEEWMKQAREYAKQKIVVDYVQETLSNINRMSYSIKNYLEFLKYQGGFGL